MDKAERKVLSMVEQGQISPDEGLKLINAMKREADQPEVEVVGVEEIREPQDPPHPIPQEELDRIERLKGWWVLPFGIGLFVTLLGAIWMYNGYMNKGFGVGFWLAWLPFLAGIFIIAVSFQTSKHVWFHVRIKQRPGEHPGQINLSLPLPLSLAKWGLSLFGNKVPGLKDQPIAEINGIFENLSPKDPFYIHVNDEDGEEVEVFIG